MIIRVRWPVGRGLGALAGGRPAGGSRRRMPPDVYTIYIYIYVCITNRYMYMYVYMYIYIYTYNIYIYIERERDTYAYIYIYVIYIYIYIYMYPAPRLRAPPGDVCQDPSGPRRDNIQYITIHVQYNIRLQYTIQYIAIQVQYNILQYKYNTIYVYLLYCTITYYTWGTHKPTPHAETQFAQGKSTPYK